MTNPDEYQPHRSLIYGLPFLSAASLVFEIHLTRIFSVAQFYHFAFMIISIALLGYGASGTFLAIFPAIQEKTSKNTFSVLALFTGVSMLISYIVLNWLPFDSFSITWDRRQFVLLVIDYMALTVPFFFTGLVVGLLLSVYPHVSGRIYSINLLGSSVGCALAVLLPPIVGGEGMVVVSTTLAVIAALIIVLGNLHTKRFRSHVKTTLTGTTAICVLLILMGDLSLRVAGKSPTHILDMQISPYKSISYAMQYPGAELVSSRWNAFSRVDLIHSRGIHSLPGLSYRYMGLLQIEDGLLVDGDDLNPIIRPGTDHEFTQYLMTSVAYQLRPEADALIIAPRGGLEVFTALASKTDRITVIEDNPLIVEAVGDLYQNPRITVVTESERSFLRNTGKSYDLIIYPLTSSYHPVRSGAYSLSEDYRYTVESLEDALATLTNDGILVVSRWLQVPPSECLRLFALAATAVENSGGNPERQIVAYRGYNMLTILAKTEPFSGEEVQRIKEFTADKAFDMTYAYGIDPQETNLYNIFPESVYFQVFTELLKTQPHEEFYQSYPYDVTPPTDDRPFFSHFFKWNQARELISEIGKTWQPFGGAGYFVILGLLGITLILSIVMIILPVLVVKFREKKKDNSLPRETHLSFYYLIYFGAIGLAYFLVEIPLFQRYILYLGHPTYALTTVLFALLLFSGLGSRCSYKFPLKYSLFLLCILLLCTPVVLPFVFSITLRFPLHVRFLITALSIAPIGFLMGIPFPAGIAWFFSEDRDRISIPWVWAINGTASVISSVAAALFILSFGFNRIFLIGALCYGIALFTAMVPKGKAAILRLHQ